MELRRSSKSKWRSNALCEEDHIHQGSVETTRNTSWREMFYTHYPGKNSDCIHNRYIIRVPLTAEPDQLPKSVSDRSIAVTFPSYEIVFVIACLKR
jgi:hypothetical protein